jgi:sugar lactone lactonase YvrE
MDELIRGSMHEALDVELPAGLRSRVVAAVPMSDRRQRRLPRLRSGWAGQWAAGLVATVLAIAVIAGLIYSRSALSSPSPSPGAAHGAQPTLISPEGIAVAPDGTVYVSDFVGDRVFRVAANGALVTVAGGGSGGDGPATKAFLNHPSGLVVDRDGNLYFADSQGTAVRRIDHHENLSTVLSPITAPFGLALDSSGALYVSTFYGDIRRIDMSGSATYLDISSVPPPAWLPGYMAFDSAGNLYISDAAPNTTGDLMLRNPNGGCRIFRVTPEKRLTAVAGTGTCGFSGDGGLATSAELNDPNGIAFDSAGNLYFADTNNHRIRRIDRNGIISTVAGTGILGYSGDEGPATQAELAYPFGIGIGSGDELYVSDASCYCFAPAAPGHVRLIRLSEGKITTLVGD